MSSLSICKFPWGISNFNLYPLFWLACGQTHPHRRYYILVCIECVLPSRALWHNGNWWRFNKCFTYLEKWSMMAIVFERLLICSYMLNILWKIDNGFKALSQTAIINFHNDPIIPSIRFNDSLIMCRHWRLDLRKYDLQCCHSQVGQRHRDKIS